MKVRTRFEWKRALLLVGILAAAGRPAIEVAAADDAVLERRVRDLVHGMKDVPLPLVIKALSDCEVLPWSGEDASGLEAVALTVLRQINEHGIDAPRVNEAGNVVERHVIAALSTHGFAAHRPAGPSGRARAAGYPDLEVTQGERLYYVEVKSFGAATIDSTQRTFYLSPSIDFKVTKDAFHLLIAVELEQTSTNRYHARSARWLDLARLRCDLKHEFNASNRDLYDPSQNLEIVLVEPPDPAVLPD